MHTYLKEIGRVPLLNAELEVEIAQTIEEGNAAAARVAAHELALSGEGPQEDLLDAADLSKNRRLVRKGLKAKDELDRGQPAPRRLDRQALPQPRPRLPRPDPGGQPRPDARGRQVRPHEGLQVLDVRHVVDPPGHHPRHRRPGADDPHPGAHGRDDQQGRVGPAPARSRSSAASRPIEEVAQRVELPIERVREILRINQDTVSLEQPVGDEDDFNLSDLIEDRGAVVPDDAATRSLLDAAVREALGHLSDARAGCGPPALRPRRRQDPHARRGRQGVRGDARAGPPDRDRRPWPSCAGQTPPTCSGTTSKSPDRLDSSETYDLVVGSPFRITVFVSRNGSRPFDATLAADARLLEAAERHAEVGAERVVPDRARAQLAGDLRAPGRRHW